MSVLRILLLLLLFSETLEARFIQWPEYPDFAKSAVVLLADREKVLQEAGGIRVKSPIFLKGQGGDDIYIDDVDSLGRTEGAKSLIIYAERRDGELVAANWSFPFIPSSLAVGEVFALWRGPSDPRFLNSLPRLLAAEKNPAFWTLPVSLIVGGPSELNAEAWHLVDKLEGTCSPEERHLLKLAFGIQALGDELFKEAGYLETDFQEGISPEARRGFRDWQYYALQSPELWFHRNKEKVNPGLLARFTLHQSGKVRSRLLHWLAEKFPPEMVADVLPLLDAKDDPDLQYTAVEIIFHSRKAGGMPDRRSFKKNPSPHLEKARQLVREM